TAYFGKWHCGTVRDQIPPEVRRRPDEYKGCCQRTPEYHRAGFQDWHGFENLNQHFASYYYKGSDANPTKVEGYETDGLTDIVLDYLAHYDRDEPLFLVLSITPPHFPLIVPERWKRFDPAALEVRPNFNRKNAFFPTIGEEDEGAMRERLAAYYAMIENLDWNLGRLMDAVERLPAFQGNTCSVYFSDHGDYMGSHGLFNAKEAHHEESVRIPAIFHAPGRIPAQGLRPGLFSLVDLMATTLGLAGAPAPPHSQGTDWSPALRGEAQTGPDAVLLEMAGNPRWNLRFLDWRGLVTERWKYAFCETGREELFDLENDPYELQDLAGRDTGTAATMRAKLLELLAASREPYFDVLIEHGVGPEGPVLDVSKLDPDLPMDTPHKGM
ncbi:MAG: sulfatase-like hydrolase/transferase, partial [Planctomycetota bacterium]